MKNGCCTENVQQPVLGFTTYFFDLTRSGS